MGDQRSPHAGRGADWKMSRRSPDKSLCGADTGKEEYFKTREQDFEKERPIQALGGAEGRGGALRGA